MNFRPAQLADYDQVEAIWHQQNSYHAALEPARIRLAETVVAFEDYASMLADVRRALLLAEVDDVVCAAALVVERHYAGSLTVSRGVAFVQEICVAEAQRGQGIGRAFMAHIEEWARARSLPSVELNVWASNQGARAFYEELGFAALRLELTKQLM